LANAAALASPTPLSSVTGRAASWENRRDTAPYSTPKR
jgi:hypothetical protein